MVLYFLSLYIQLRLYLYSRTVLCLPCGQKLSIVVSVMRLSDGISGFNCMSENMKEHIGHIILNDIALLS